MISLSPVTLTGISMRLACLYTTARLFINCPNETKWEISSEVRKVFFLILAVCCILLGAGSIYGLYRYIEPQLPDVATLKDVRLQIPMQIYSADGELIAQYGEKRRIPVTLDQIPPEMVKAFIATEDSRFYEHHGVDPVGIFQCSKRGAVLRSRVTRGQVPLPSSWRETSSSVQNAR